MAELQNTQLILQKPNICLFFFTKSILSRVFFTCHFLCLAARHCGNSVRALRAHFFSIFWHLRRVTQHQKKINIFGVFFDAGVISFEISDFLVLRCGISVFLLNTLKTVTKNAYTHIHSHTYSLSLTHTHTHTHTHTRTHTRTRTSLQTRL